MAGMETCIRGVRAEGARRPALMKPLIASTILCATLFAGCTAPQTYRQPPGGAGTPVPDTTPSLGPPANSFDAGGGASYGPSGGGPSLGMPEPNAWRDDPSLRSPRAAREQS